MWTIFLASLVAVGSVQAQYDARLQAHDPRNPYNPQSAQRHEQRGPEYVRVEVELVKLNNDGAISYDNAYCDVGGNACDTVVVAALDTEMPFREWPGPSDPAYWSEVFKADNTNSPNLGKVLTRDSCGKPFKSAVARVVAEDADNWSYTTINHWQCAVGGQPAGQEWSPVKSCTSRYKPDGKDLITLTYRYKVYSISAGECRQEVRSTLRPGAVTGTTRARPTTKLRKALTR